MYIRHGSPDILYIVKQSEDNPELKYSLRSLKNLNHGHVFIAGYKPSWVDERVEHIPNQQSGNKYQNIRSNWVAALNDPRLGDEFVLMNDDFYVLKPTKYVPALRRLKPIEHYIELFSKVNPDSYYVTTMKQARDLVRSWGIKEVDSYELHVPMTFNKQKAKQLLTLLPDDYPLTHFRTLYGNYYKLGGERIRDVKIVSDTHDISYDGRFLSTHDDYFENSDTKDFLEKKFAKVLAFSHANDPDGLLSVILAQLAFGEVDYLLTNNPQSDITEYLATHDVDEYDFVIISDIYPGRPVLEALPKAYWFDHKQNSLDKIAEHGFALENACVELELNGKPASGSQLMYRWLRKEGLVGSEAESFVEHIRKVDTWDYS